MEGTNRRGRSRREWLDDITEWDKASVQELSQAAMDRKSWKSLVKTASDTYGAEPTVLDDDDDDYYNLRSMSFCTLGRC